MHILHVGSSSAFVDFLVRYFERAAPGQNRLVRYPAAPQATSPLGTAFAAVGYARQLVAIVRAARRADLVVAHMMTLPSALAVLGAPARAYRVWSGWGADYYGSGAGDTEGLLGSQTEKLVADLGLDRAPQGGLLVRHLTERVVDRAISKVDTFSAPIPDDFDIMRQRHPGFHGAYHQLNYADIASFKGPSVIPAGGDILLGNSAWSANNHLEALEHLSGLDLGDRKILTPLAYGDRTYRDIVVERGRALFGDAFVPLLEPLPFDRYLDRVSRCGVVVMNHFRQQGLGNIGIGLYSGAHIYLSRRNPLHAFLSRAGLDIHEFETATTLPRAPVVGAALERRRELMRAIWGEDVVLGNVQRLLNAARSSGRDD
ncbi:TDP-N-acetylfucosamine:lipid II N-acetylfucosaminyltransferase [Knoellia sp. p5-6-4]|uniref:TDP-N-acetylfucosamine:lipid II N-acetylfucosaminyltransferase n=1 Tax=unclassified Knoellia TaxID=2618719 RepID=UPI0023DA733A|nr:TDP-N-acetylfucosamine:lipid II N-acetylfucosaminyltransferase [Knoellia sp. p5-6-4]MDF2146608.1 TDP-N-acetylfucosamine:lipid II N-acetylfucosaminyltransferase [Knoellia sp. p5-6-4]